MRLLQLVKPDNGGTTCAVTSSQRRAVVGGWSRDQRVTRTERGDWRSGDVVSEEGEREWGQLCDCKCWEVLEGGNVALSMNCTGVCFVGVYFDRV